MVVESQDLLTDALDARIDQIQAVFTRIDVPNDPVVDVYESVFSLLHRSEHPIEQLNLIHLIRTQIDLSLCKTTR